jgi:hypothetical protein
MKKLKIISRTGHLLLVLCFFMPFCRGCSDEPSAEEKASKSKQDSIYVTDSIKNHSIEADTSGSVRMKTDSIHKDSLNINPGSIDTLAISDDEVRKQNIDKGTKFIANAANKETFYERVILKILYPGGDISGVILVATAISTMVYEGKVSLEALSLCFAFLFVLIVFVLSLTRKWYASLFLRFASLFGITSLLILYFKQSDDAMYGMLVTVIVWIANLSLVLFINKQQKDSAS